MSQERFTTGTPTPDRTRMRWSPAIVATFFTLALILTQAAEPNPSAPTPEAETLFKTTCAACHGPRGEGNQLVQAPAIAGMPEWYASEQLRRFRSGTRGFDTRDTPGMVMSAIARTLTPEQVDSIAEHLETIPFVIPAPRTRTDAKTTTDLLEGKYLYEERCMECHRYNGKGDLAFASPPLIGQPAWYLETQLRKYKQGIRGSIPGDINGAKMVHSVLFIASDQSLRDVVAYILTLNPIEPKIPPPPEKTEIDDLFEPKPTPPKK